MPVLEGRALVWVAKHLALSVKNFGHRHLVINGCMPAILALSKGRSSSSSLNRVCRQRAAYIL
eukprot:12751117-Alexandrium_andersonii.AAC.1